LKGSRQVKIARHLTSGSCQYWLFFYHKQLPAWKG